MMDRLAAGCTLRNRAFVATMVHTNLMYEYDVTLLDPVSQSAVLYRARRGGGPCGAQRAGSTASSRKRIAPDCSVLPSSGSAPQAPILAYQMVSARRKGRDFLPQPLLRSSSSFQIHAFKAINLPCNVYFSLQNIFLTLLGISLMYGLLRNVLLNFQISTDFPNVIRLLISNLIF